MGNPWIQSSARQEDHKNTSWMTAHFPSMANYKYCSHNNWLILKEGTSFPACLGYLSMRGTVHHKVLLSTQECLPCVMRGDTDILELTANSSWAVQSPLDLPPRPETTHLGLHCAATQLRIPVSQDEDPQLTKARNLCADIQTRY